MFSQRQNHLRMHFAEPILLVTQHMTEFYCCCLEHSENVNQVKVVNSFVHIIYTFTVIFQAKYQSLYFNQNCGFVYLPFQIYIFFLMYRVGQKYVYSCQKTKQFILVLLLIKYCIIFHSNNHKVTFAPPCILKFFYQAHTHLGLFGEFTYLLCNVS